MAELRCEICGNRLMFSGGMIECGTCGMIYSKEWAREQFQMNPPVQPEPVMVHQEPQWPAEVEPESPYAEEILAGLGLYEQGKNKEAEAAFRGVLAKDETCPEASLAMLLVCPVKEREQYEQAVRQHARTDISSLEQQMCTGKPLGELTGIYARLGDSRRVEYAMDHGGKLKVTAFCDAALRPDADPELIRTIITHGFDPNATVTVNYSDGTGTDPVLSRLIAKNADLKILQVLLDCGADPNRNRIMKAKGGYTNEYSPLHDTIWRTKNPEQARLLLESGADPDYYAKIRFSDGSYAEKSMVSEAILEKNEHILRLLLEHGANPNVTRLRQADNCNQYYTPLNDSIWYAKSLQMLELLLSHGADVEQLTRLYFADGTYEEKRTLSQAILENDEQMVELVLRYDADPDGLRLRRTAKGDSYYPPLADSISKAGNPRMIRMLIARGANLKFADRVYFDDGSYGERMFLSLAVQANNVDLVRLLLESGADVNSRRLYRDEFGSTFYSALSDSIWNVKNGDIARLLLEHGADAHYVNKMYFADGVYAEKNMLSEAVGAGQVELVQLLLDYGADVNSCRLHRSGAGDNYYSPLSDSIWNVKNRDIAKLLLEHGADVHFVNKVFFDTGVYAEKNMLSEAVLVNRPDLVRLLLDYGADVNSVRLRRIPQGDQRFSALSDSIWSVKNIEITRLLLDRGANVHHVDKAWYDNGTYGEKPMLSVAVIEGNPQVVRLLLEHGANPNCKRLYQCSSYSEYYWALSDAIWNKQNIEIVTDLLKRGAKASAHDERTNADGSKAVTCMLHYAAEYAGSPDMLRLLVRYGASVNNPVTHNGNTIGFRRYPYSFASSDINQALKEIGWKGPGLFGR